MLLRARDRLPEVDYPISGRPAGGCLKPGCGGIAASDLDVRGKFGSMGVRFGPGYGLEFHIAPDQHFRDSWIEALRRLGLNYLDGFIEWECAPVLAVGSESVEAVHRGEDPRPHGNLLSREPVR